MQEMSAEEFRGLVAAKQRGRRRDGVEGMDWSCENGHHGWTAGAPTVCPKCGGRVVFASFRRERTSSPGRKKTKGGPRYGRA